MATPKDLPQDIGSFIRDLRQTAQISLRQLADKAGVSNPYLSQIERGLRKPSAEVLQQIASALRVSTPAMYLRAGLLDGEGQQGVLAAIAVDPDLTIAQKQSLSQIYETFRKLHPMLKDEAFLNPKEEDDDPYESSQMTVMIANPTGIFAVYSMREVFEFDRFWAIGSGRDFALGAMYSVYANAKDAAAVADAGVTAGAEFDTGTALPVSLHEVTLR